MARGVFENALKIGENVCVEFKRGGKDMVLAGRYHIIRQLGQGGMLSV